MGRLRRVPALGHDPDRPPDDVAPFEVLTDGDRVAVLGSVDSFTADRLAALLPPPGQGPVAVLDLGGLDFVDVAGCRVLARWAHAVRPRPGRLEVTGASLLVQRMWRLLALDEIAPVSFPEGRS